MSKNWVFDQIPDHMGNQNQTVDLIRNLSDTMTLTVDYYPQFQYVEGWKLRKVSDIDYKVEHYKYDAKVYLNFIDKTDFHQAISLITRDEPGKALEYKYFNVATIFKTMNDQYLPVTCFFSPDSHMNAYFTDKRRCGCFTIRDDVMERAIPEITASELYSVAIDAMSKKQVDIKLMKQVYRHYALNGMKEMIDRIIPAEYLMGD